MNIIIIITDADHYRLQAEKDNKLHIGLNIADSPTCHTHPILSVKIRKEDKGDGEEKAESGLSNERRWGEQKEERK